MQGNQLPAWVGESGVWVVIRAKGRGRSERDNEGSGRMAGCLTHQVEGSIPGLIKMVGHDELIEPTEEAINVL